jgi:hypothetical protein
MNNLFFLPASVFFMVEHPRISDCEPHSVAVGGVEIPASWFAFEPGLDTLTVMASMRNKMINAHASSYKASKHHANLAVNSAKTFTDFIFDTCSYQKGAG